MQQITLTANGLSHPALKLGNGTRLALLLHGFPDSPHTWKKLMPRLAAQGYTCIAPYLRGYTQQNTPHALLADKSATVQIADLAEDAVALVEATGFAEALLIGHDWGAIAAYAAANLAPQKFTALVTLSVPHLKVFLANLWSNPRQFLQSWYIIFFQLRLGMPERLVAKNDFSFVEELWRAWSPDLPSDNEAILQVKKLFAEKQIVHNALAYYRGMLSPSFAELARWNRSRELSFADVTVPTLTLTGSRDGCIIPEMFADMHTVIRNEFTLRILPMVGHFLPIESDERIATEITKFTATYAEVKHA